MTKYRIREHKKYDSMGTLINMRYTIQQHNGFWWNTMKHKTPLTVYELSFDTVFEAESFIRKLQNNAPINKVVSKTVKVVIDKTNDASTKSYTPD